MSKIPNSVFVVFTRSNSRYDWDLWSVYKTRGDARTGERILRENPPTQVKVREFTRPAVEAPAGELPEFKVGAEYRIRRAGWTDSRWVTIVSRNETAFEICSALHPEVCWVTRREIDSAYKRANP